MPELGCRVKPAYVHLVDDGLGEGPPEGLVAFPVVCRQVRDQALHGDGGVVARGGRGDTVVAGGQGHAAAVGIDQHLVRSEAQPRLRCLRPVDSVAIDLAGAESRHEAVPIVVGPVANGIERDHPCGPRVIDGVEEQQLDSGGTGRIDREIHAVRLRIGPEWVGQAASDGIAHRGVPLMRRLEAGLGVTGSIRVWSVVAANRG